MRKVKYVVFVLFLCVSLPASLIAQKGEILGIGENRLHNGDFEDNTVQPWQLEVMASRGAAGKMEATKKEAASGKRSVLVEVTKVVHHGSGSNVKLKQNDRCFEKDVKFTTAFWSKAEKERKVFVGFQQGRDPFAVYHIEPVTVGTEWKEYSVTFTPREDNFRDHRLMFMVGDSDIPIWFDDARFFMGERKDEVGRDPVKQAVLPVAKLATTWAQVRSEY